MPQRKTQEIELLLRSGEQEIALVARKVGSAVHMHRTFLLLALHVMAGSHNVGTELARRLQQVPELDRLVAFDAGDWRLAGEISLNEIIHHVFLELAFVVENVMGN